VFLEVSTNPVMIQAKQKFAEWKKKQADMQPQPIVPGQQPAPGQQPMVNNQAVQPQQATA